MADGSGGDGDRTDPATEGESVAFSADSKGEATDWTPSWSQGRPDYGWSPSGTDEDKKVARHLWTRVARRGLDRRVIRRAALPVAVFVGVVVAGVAGLSALADVGVVDATFWLLELTGIELHFQENAGPERLTKAYGIVVRVALVLSAIWIGETVLTAAFGGQIQEELKFMHIQREIDDLTDHVIICGYGIFGRTIANRLREAEQGVVAIELDSNEIEQIDAEEMLAIEGDARNEAVLRDAGIERARAVVAAIDESNANIQIAITASQIAPDVRMIVRVGDEMYESVARRAGADEVVIPEVVSGEQVSDLL